MIRGYSAIRLAIVFPILGLVSCQLTEKSSVREIAGEIDRLERHIENFGSVVVKQPDVGEQARLKKHREEYEKQMPDDLGTFNFPLTAPVAGSDQAYRPEAFPPSAAASGPAATITPPRTAT